MLKVLYLSLFLLRNCCKIIQPLGVIHFSSYSLLEEIDVSFMQEAKIDIKLPRRSLIVQFTCDACGERTERLINRLAYERGTVFVQVFVLVFVDSHNTFLDDNNVIKVHLFFICMLSMFSCHCNLYPLYALEEESCYVFITTGFYLLLKILIDIPTFWGRSILGANIALK